VESSIAILLECSVNYLLRLMQVNQSTHHETKNYYVCSIILVVVGLAEICHIGHRKFENRVFPSCCIIKCCLSLNVPLLSWSEQRDRQHLHFKKISSDRHSDL